MEQLVQLVAEYIAARGYTAIIIGMALESACVPIPSELIFGFAGYLVYMGKLDFMLTVGAGVIGGLLGSVAAYLVGYWGGRPFVDRYGRYLFLSSRHVDLAQRWFDRYGLRAAFFSRLLPVVRTFISLPAGFARVDLVKFVIYTLLGSLPWTIALVYAGMLLGENWQRLTAVGHQASLGMAVALLAIGAYYWRRRER